jgi:hypothetical protein
MKSISIFLEPDEYGYQDPKCGSCAQPPRLTHWRDGQGEPNLSPSRSMGRANAIHFSRILADVNELIATEQDKKMLKKHSTDGIR